jgi:iron(III) transport system substrate-binding protein
VRWFIPLLCVGIAAAGVLFLLQPDDDALVVYCAHDAVYSREILDEFTRQTGIKVSVRFDTEATKSLGLVNLLVAEKDNPRCDVFWNNQVLGTIHLQSKGILRPFKGTGWERIPADYKDPDGYWTGFAGRLRVIIYNTDNLAVDEVDQGLEQDLAKFAFAKPMFGTTLTHFSVLWRDLGADQTRQLHAQLKQRGARMVAGNSTVKNVVADGACDFGWTDTDDYFVAKDDGRPVDILPIRTEDGLTICIPNSVAIIQGSQREADGQRLVEYLLSQATELRLARSRARQIPLGTLDAEADSEIPDNVRPLIEWAKEAVRYDAALAVARDECLEWLSSEYLE